MCLLFDNFTVSWNSKNGWNNVTASTVTEQDTSLYQNSVTTGIYRQKYKIMSILRLEMT